MLVTPGKKTKKIAGAKVDVGGSPQCPPGSVAIPHGLTGLAKSRLQKQTWSSIAILILCLKQ